MNIKKQYSVILLRALVDLALDGKKWPEGIGKQVYGTFQKDNGFITSSIGFKFDRWEEFNDWIIIKTYATEKQPA